MVNKYFIYHCGILVSEIIAPNIDHVINYIHTTLSYFIYNSHPNEFSIEEVYN